MHRLLGCLGTTVSGERRSVGYLWMESPTTIQRHLVPLHTLLMIVPKQPKTQGIIRLIPSLALFEDNPHSACHCPQAAQKSWGSIAIRLVLAFLLSLFYVILPASWE